MVVIDKIDMIEMGVYVASIAVGAFIALSGAIGVVIGAAITISGCMSIVFMDRKMRNL